MKRAALALFGGDACREIWAAILRRSRDEELQGDLLLSPHHCSWGFFNEVPYEKHKEPKKSSLDILEKHRRGASVIASSKPLKDDDNPPHYAAKKEYVRVVGGDNFYCTGEHPSEKKPEPVIFTMTGNEPGRTSPLITPPQIGSGKDGYPVQVIIAHLHSGPAVSYPYAPRLSCA